MKNITFFVFLFVVAVRGAAQPASPVIFTAEQDHSTMMKRLGITVLRPGPSGDEKASNHANYDEALANPYPNLPEVLVLKKPAQPPAEDVEKVNAAIKQLLVRDHPELQQIFDKYPAYDPVPAQAPSGFGQPRPVGDPPTAQQLIADGWGYILIDPNSIQADKGAGLTRGIIGLVNKGQPRKPDDWGALRAWAWGAARALDYLEANEPMVDAKHVGIEGVSRYGKAALVTLALEPRFAMGLIGSSGEGGAKLHRRNFGEAVENITGWREIS
jgi:hypothetical protein